MSVVVVHWFVFLFAWGTHKSNQYTWVVLFLQSVVRISISLSLAWTCLTYAILRYSTLDAHAIYLLNLLLAFLQPRFDPSLQDDLMADEIEEGGEETSPTLPSQRDDEFRPFVRRLPEWQFWYVFHRNHPPPSSLILLCNAAHLRNLFTQTPPSIQVVSNKSDYHRIVLLVL